MIIFKTIKGIQQLLENFSLQGKKIGFVPTMGALHEGHLSLLETSREENDISVCSVFINPSQFNNQNDFIKYPVRTENDILLLEKNQADIVFMPTQTEMNSLNFHEKIAFNLDGLDLVLEGSYRPGHFQGVCEVVEKLVKIVQPTNLYLGEKDYQQCLVLKKLISLLQLDIQIRTCPISRAESGLALSSRNMRLSAEGKIRAATIYKMLCFIKVNLTTNNWPALKESSREMLLKNGFESVDYLEMCMIDSLQILDQAPENQEVIILVAAFIEGVRLIDNIKTTAKILTN